MAEAAAAHAAVVAAAAAAAAGTVSSATRIAHNDGGTATAGTKLKGAKLKTGAAAHARTLPFTARRLGRAAPPPQPTRERAKVRAKTCLLRRCPSRSAELPGAGVAGGIGRAYVGVQVADGPGAREPTTHNTCTHAHTCTHMHTAYTHTAHSTAQHSLHTHQNYRHRHGTAHGRCPIAAVSDNRPPIASHCGSTVANLSPRLGAIKAIGRATKAGLLERAAGADEQGWAAKVRLPV